MLFDKQNEISTFRAWYRALVIVISIFTGITNGFAEKAGKDITSHSYRTMEVYLGDLDGDGDLDLVEIYGENKTLAGIFKNSGNGEFNHVQTITPTDIQCGALTDPNYHSVWGQCGAIGDLDGDGDIDVVVGCAGGIYPNGMIGTDDLRKRMYVNDGNGNFSERVITSDYRDTKMLRLGDIDGDGDLDLFAAHDRESLEPLRYLVWVEGKTSGSLNSNLAPSK